MLFWKDVDRQREGLAWFSKEHQTALTIARQIKEGCRQTEVGPNYPIGTEAKRDRVVGYFDTVWEKHQKAEENGIFPLAEKQGACATDLLPRLRKQHGQLTNLIEQLRQAKSVQLENLLLRVGQALEEHVRRHERLFHYLRGEALNSKEPPPEK